MARHSSVEYFRGGALRESCTTMGWRVINGRRYFYRAFRFCGEVQVVYLGNGPDAQREAQLLEKRKQARETRKRVIADIARLMELAEQTSGQLNLLIRAAIVTAGYYRHGGEWRRRRFKVPLDHPVVRPPVVDLKDLVREANSGEPGAVAALRQFLREHPKVWHQVGDLTSRTLEARIKRITRGNSLLAESIRLQIEEFRKRLASPEPSGVERLAIDGVVLAWVEVHQAELAAQVERNLPYQDLSRPLENAARRRFAAAMRLFVFVKGKMADIERTYQELQRDQAKDLPPSEAATQESDQSYALKWRV